MHRSLGGSLAGYCFKTTLEEDTGIMVFDEVLV
jgi:hypothetical protein